MFLRILDHLKQCSECEPAKKFSHPSFSCLYFSNPTHKTKTGIANRWEITNSNPAGPIKLSSQSIAGVIRLCLGKPCEKCWAKNILLSQTGMF